MKIEEIERTIRRLAQANPRHKEYEEYYDKLSELGKIAELTDDEVNSIFEWSTTYGFNVGDKNEDYV